MISSFSQKNLALLIAVALSMFAPTYTYADDAENALADQTISDPCAGSALAGSAKASFCRAEGKKFEAMLRLAAPEAFVDTNPGSERIESLPRNDGLHLRKNVIDIDDIDPSSKVAPGQAGATRTAALTTTDAANRTNDTANRFWTGAGIGVNGIKGAKNFAVIAETHYRDLQRRKREPNTSAASRIPWQNERDPVLPKMTQGEFYRNYPAIKRQNDDFLKKLTSATKILGQQAFNNAAAADHLTFDTKKLRQVERQLHEIGVPTRGAAIRRPTTIGTNANGRASDVGEGAELAEGAAFDQRGDKDAIEFDESRIGGRAISGGAELVSDAENGSTTTIAKDKETATGKDGKELSPEMKGFVDKALAKIKENEKELKKLSELKGHVDSRIEANIASIEGLTKVEQDENVDGYKDDGEPELVGASRIPARNFTPKNQFFERTSDVDAELTRAFDDKVGLSEINHVSSEFSAFEASTSIFKQVRAKIQLAHRNGAIGF